MPAKTPNLTHFLSIPLVNSTSRPQLQASLRRFVDDIAAEPAIQISPNDIKHVGSLHLTLGVMSLETKERFDSACALLHRLDIAKLMREAITPHPADFIKLDEPMETAQSVLSLGLDSDLEKQKAEPQDPCLRISLLDLCAIHSLQSTSVLFAKPMDSTNRLFNVCCAIRKEFSVANLLERPQTPLLLHATIVNIRSKGGSKRTRRPSRTDATALITKYKGFEWAKDIRLEKVSICSMRAEKVFENDIIVDAVYTEMDHVILP